MKLATPNIRPANTADPDQLTENCGDDSRDGRQLQHRPRGRGGDPAPDLQSSDPGRGQSDGEQSPWTRQLTARVHAVSPGSVDTPMLAAQYPCTNERRNLRAGK